MASRQMLKNSGKETFGIGMEHEEFPFKTTLSLDFLFEFWRDLGSGEACIGSDLANSVMREVDRVPELHGPIRDFSILENHQSLVDALMFPVFPAATRDTDYAAALPPFTFRPFFETPAFARHRLFKDGKLLATMNIDEGSFNHGKILTAYTSILHRFYGLESPMHFSLVSSSSDPKTGLDRYYKWQMNSRFCDIVHYGKLRPLSTLDQDMLFRNMLDLNIWRRMIPPEEFEMRGFVIFRGIDVTSQEILSTLKFDLIEQGSIFAPGRFETLQQKIRTLLHRPEIRIGLTALPDERGLAGSKARSVGSSFALNDSCSFTFESYEKSVYRETMKQKEIRVIDDLETFEDPKSIEYQIARQGIRNLVLVPLLFEGNVVGMLEVASPNPRDITPITALNIGEVIPLLALALRRAMDDLDVEVRGIIREKYTVIHPSVEWRFREAALRLVEKRKSSQFAEVEPIIFEGVYPLYGLTDIRDSSTTRNQAIQTDLIAQLEMARAIVTNAAAHAQLPILDELNFRIDRHIESLQMVLVSGDEPAVINFLQQDVEPLFTTLEEIHPRVKNSIDAYRTALDPQLDVLYRERKRFDESVTQLNDAVSAFIDEQEGNAQEMFPHYFEKYKTDGVEHSMYIGASLTEGKIFNPLFLKNLRLWQLMMMCGVAVRCEEINKKLPLRLETVHLILVQDVPLSIRFRVDEKKFDVHGAYNIRYEIMKKRIDKARIKETKERLTQPGKLAIVYSQPEEAAEYTQYLEYLSAKGYIADTVEELEVEDLQGIAGLRALRVAITTTHKAGEPKNLAEHAAKVLSN